MKKNGRLIDLLDDEKITNRHLRDLVAYLKKGLVTAIDPLALAPETAQIMPAKWHHHSDHTDYQAHQDSSSGNPRHSDYCD